MFDALIFSTVNALEFGEVRRNVIRIPEVIHRVREAQAIWDQVSGLSLDLANFIGSDDQGFLGHLRLKNLATAVIQLGILDRLTKEIELPEYLAGLSNGDAPLRVASRQQTFEDLIRSSQALMGLRPQTNGSVTSLPILAGVSLAEFSVLRRNEVGYAPVVEHEMDIRKTLKCLLQSKPKRLVIVGPGQSHIQFLLKELGASGVEVVDSVNLDPVLSWFWREAQEPLSASAMQ
jgi:hypothetical protein